MTSLSATVARSPSPRLSIRNYIVAALALMMLLIGGIGGWAATTRIAGAVFASGELILDGRSLEVQHRDGGIVSHMAVRDGDVVDAGDLLFSMDPTELQASRIILDNQLVEQMVRQARLEAELSEQPEITFPKPLVDRAAESFVASLMQQESDHLKARQAALAGETNRLRERSRQINNEIAGLEAQLGAKQQEIRLIAQERDALGPLQERGLVEVTRILTLERTQARLSGEEGLLIASIAQSLGQISEVEIEILRIANNRRAQALEELTATRGRVAELSEQLNNVQARLARMDVRAPLSGVIHELALTSPGSLVSAERTILKLVPVQNRLIVEARIEPQDVDQIRLGDSAALRFSAFSQSTTPEILGTVTHLSADRTDDAQTGAAWYTVRLEVSDAEKQRLGDGLALLPGMPVDVFLQTEERTVLSYLVKPLADHLQRAFIED